jgi:hypothetical protein
MMKKVVILMALLAFVAAGVMTAYAADAPKTVKCCVKGECKDMTKADCTKAKGKVVKDCKTCKK